MRVFTVSASVFQAEILLDITFGQVPGRVSVPPKRTGTASLVAERAGIPFVNGSSSSPALTERGLKYFFRVSPHDGQFTKLMFDFLDEFQKKKNVKISSASILHEDSAFGTDSATTQEKFINDKKYKLLDKITYNAKATSLSSEVQKLKASNADLLLPSSYTADTYLFLKTAKELKKYSIRREILESSQEIAKKMKNIAP